MSTRLGSNRTPRALAGEIRTSRHDRSQPRVQLLNLVG